ncbi:hypothetical protein LZC95_06740 [Pendulispora brunnea]|uniref:Uncharacterized protein n=1 Tax=Pendulispora brunnea TaxID=2905690 RepID=A0ABZ2KD48_9BACT
MPNARLAYLADRQVHLLFDDGETEILSSAFVEDVRRREASIDRKTSWKTQGTGARFMGAAALWDDAQGKREPAFFVALSRGRRPGELLYAVTTGVVSGIFAYDVATKGETRLVHGTDGVALSMATSDDHRVVAMTRSQKNGSCNVAVMRDDGGEVALVTDGDTVDGAPSWVPVGPEVTAGRHQLVYQSSGVGRDETGMLAGLGPSEIHLLDAEHAKLRTLVAHPDFDYLSPRMMQDGTLFAIRRPYHRGPAAPNAGEMLRDGLVAPLRLMYAGFRYLDYFTMRYTGKPMSTLGNTRGRQVDARRLHERQNLASAGEVGQPDELPRAPREWALVRRTPHGDETVVAESVAGYDFERNGALLLTDGAAITRVAPDGQCAKLADAPRVTTLVSLV